MQLTTETEALHAHTNLACLLCHATDNRNGGLAGIHQSSVSFVSHMFLAHHELESDNVVIILYCYYCYYYYY
jgi:hypothetical protein